MTTLFRPSPKNMSEIQKHSCLNCMQIKRIESIHNSIYLKLIGNLDMNSSKQLKADLLVMEKSGIAHCIVDMSETEYIDSSCLAVLIYLISLLKRRNGSVKLVNVPQHIHELLVLTKFLSKFKLYSTYVEAVNSIQES